MNVTQTQGWLQWIDENKYEALASSIIIIGLAMIMFGAAAADISSFTYPDHSYTWTGDDWNEVSSAMCATGSKTVAIAVAGLEGGPFVLAIGIAFKVGLYQHKKTERAGIENTTTEDAQKAVREKRLKAAGLMLGFLVTLLGVGFIASTSVGVHEISNVKSLMSEFPKYRPEMQEWINQVEPSINGLLATGVLVSIVGGGIFGGTLFFAQLKAAWNKHFRQISDESAASQNKGDADL